MPTDAFGLVSVIATSTQHWKDNFPRSSKCFAKSYTDEWMTELQELFNARQSRICPGRFEAMPSINSVEQVPNLNCNRNRINYALSLVSSCSNLLHYKKQHSRDQSENSSRESNCLKPNSLKRIRGESVHREFVQHKQIAAQAEAELAVFLSGKVVEPVLEKALG